MWGYLNFMVLTTWEIKAANIYMDVSIWQQSCCLEQGTKLRDALGKDQLQNL